MDSIPSSKACSKCGQVKPLSEFHKRSNTKDGRTRRCKECRARYRREYYLANKERSAEQSRQWREENHQRHLGNKRRWYWENQDRAAAYWQEYYFQNSVRLNRRSREIYYPKAYKKKRKLIIERVKKWRQENPGTVRVIRMRYRVRRKNASGDFTAEEWETLCEKYGRKCLACGKRRKLTVDHVVALSNGGTNDISNIQPLCGPCNSSKGAQTIDYRY